MSKIILMVIVFTTSIISSYAQTIKWEGKEFEVSNVNASVVSLNGEKVLKVERDLEKLSFGLEATVNEPTFVKLKDLNPI